MYLCREDWIYTNKIKLTTTWLWVASLDKIIIKIIQIHYTTCEDHAKTDDFLTPVDHIASSPANQIAAFPLNNWKASNQ